MKGFCEIRGIVNKDGTMSFGEFTQYDDEFGKDLISLFYVCLVDLGTYESMLEYYHGMCRELCIR